MKNLSWEKTIEQLFINFGLSGKEARVYRVILEIGQGSAAAIVTKANLKRGITYAILYNLEKQGFIRRLNIKGKTVFQVENPQKLLEIIEQKKQEISLLSENMKDIVPKLVSQYKITVGKPTIRYYEGEEGIKTVFEDIYKPKEDVVYGCVDLEVADQAFPSYIVQKLIPKRIQNKVKACSLIADSSQAQELAKHDEEQFRTSILLPKDKYPLPAEIDVYEDKTAFLSFKKGEFIGMLIENKEIAQSLRTVFKLALEAKSKGKSTPV